MATVKRGFPWLLGLAGLLVLVALIGAVTLLCLGKPVPSELWALVSGGFTFLVGGAAWSFKPAQPVQ
jgi:hypothetical protein